MRGLQSAKNLDQGAIGIPAIEQAPNGLPGAEFLGQVPPRRARAKNPKDAVKHHAPIAGRSASGFGFWEEILDTVPGSIGEQVAGHRYAFLGNEK